MGSSLGHSAPLNQVLTKNGSIVLFCFQTNDIENITHLKIFLQFPINLTLFPVQVATSNYL